MHPPAVREHARALAAAGHKDADVARRTGLPRTTVRDLRRAPAPGICPRCWRRGSLNAWTDADYAFLLGLYLGDGYVCRAGRTFRLRLSLDTRYAGVIGDARSVLDRGFAANRVGETRADRGSTTVLSVYNSHLPCLLPQHGPGLKHRRRIQLEPWQDAAVKAAPYEFIKGCVWSDGCTFVNRTGRYEYLTVDFCNSSEDIRGLFAGACCCVGLDYRMNADRVRINRRASVERLVARIGTKR
jgi:hypothetical protein